MKSKVTEKWRINREKNEFARKLREWCVNEKAGKSVTIQLEHPCLIQAFVDGTLYVEDSQVWEHPSKIWEMVNGLEEWLKVHHPGFLHQLQHFQQLDEEATRKARVAKILGAIANNLDELPELESELVKLGRMLERGEDIKGYCRNFESSGE